MALWSLILLIMLQDSTITIHKGLSVIKTSSISEPLVGCTVSLDILPVVEAIEKLRVLK